MGSPIESLTEFRERAIGRLRAAGIDTDTHKDLVLDLCMIAMDYAEGFARGVWKVKT